MCGGITTATTLPSVVGSSAMPMSPSAMVQARMRAARNARHTIDFDFNNVDRRVRNNNDEHNNGASNSNMSQAQDEETTAIRCDSPVISRLGPVLNCSNSNSSTGDALEVTLLNNNSNSSNNSGTTTGNSNLNRRRCGKTSTVDLRSHPAQNQRFPLPEQIDDCPSSGDEGVVSPRKRIKMDYHHHHHSNASAVSPLNTSI